MIALDAHPRNVFSEYREFPVPASLANHFLCFWKQVIIGSGEYAHLVLPDACIDIVFVSDDPPIVVGPWTDPFVVRFPAGTKIVGARLLPGLAVFPPQSSSTNPRPFPRYRAPMAHTSDLLLMSQCLFQRYRDWPRPWLALLPPLRHQTALLWQVSDGLPAAHTQLLSN